MELWFILIVYEIVPIVLWGLAWYYGNKFSEYPDTSKGYKSKIAKGDKEIWIYANKVASKVLGDIATLLFVLIFIGMIIIKISPVTMAFTIFILLCMSYMVIEGVIKKKIKVKRKSN